MVSDDRDAGGGVSRATEFQQALSFHRHDNLHEAERLYRTILASNPAHFDAILHLGLIILQQGNLVEAVGLFRQAVDTNPNSAEAQAALANGLLAMNRFDEAFAGYETALAIAPDQAEANFGLASVLSALQRYQDAIAYFERALAIDPDYAEADYGLATTLQALKRHDQAIPFFEKALAVDPNYAEAVHGLAAALHALNRHGEAIGFYQRAVAIERGYGPAHNNLGIALKEVGRLDEARVSFERAVALEPTRAEFYFNLLLGQETRAGDPHLSALENLARHADELPEEDQIYIHFALGKALADVSEHERSFHHYLKGNALKRRHVAYDEAATLRMFERIRAVFKPELMRSKAGQGDPSTIPVFIFGMPRSGSTLIEQILASHPKVFGGGERLDLRDALNSFGETGDIDLPFPERFLVATGDELHGLGASYLEHLRTGIPRSVADRRRITDKMLANFRLVGLIHLALPNARIIHSCRDPVDTCLSCFSTLFFADQPFTYELGELGRYYRAYHSLMEHWRRVLPEDVMLDLDYEELVADFEPQARRIVAHCGLEWDDACLAYDKTARAVKTASAAQVRQPIYRSSVGRWRPDADMLKPLLDGLGPDLAGDPKAGGGNHLR
jgi:tetratricopeptide (TPR) repeat protein